MHKLPEVYEVGDKVYIALVHTLFEPHLRIYGPVSIGKVNVVFKQEKIGEKPTLTIEYKCLALGEAIVKPEMVFNDYETAYQTVKVALEETKTEIERKSQILNIMNAVVATKTVQAEEAKAQIKNAAAAAKAAQDKMLGRIEEDDIVNYRDGGGRRDRYSYNADDF